MNEKLKALLQQAIQAAEAAGALVVEADIDIPVERARDRQHGDYASPVALALARAAKRNPREIAATIVEHLPSSTEIAAVSVAGPGFINFKLADTEIFRHVQDILVQGAEYGRSHIGAGKKIQVEFVSANPTGPLHVGHGRGAAYGATIANLLANAGYQVQREYYVNDAGRQMDILALSVWLRYLELAGESLEFPTNGYQGDYVWDIAATLHRENGDRFRISAADLFARLPDDPERRTDELIARAKRHLGEADYRLVFDAGLEALIDNIRLDLAQFGVNYDRWYRERSLVESGAIDRAMAKLEDSGHAQRRDGALWFKTTDFGDEKDRVLVREDGRHTYFAADVAYHMDKFDRGFDRVIDIWGADHHGYIARVKASVQAMGTAADRLDVMLVQFAILYRNGEKVSMSTRSGEFVTLRELRHEVGNDAARFFYVMRKADQHLDFDLDLAKSKSNDNPVYYVQYAHARICSVFRQLAEKNLEFTALEAQQLHGLDEPQELALLNRLSQFPEVTTRAARDLEPHQIAAYLRELANNFHSYYNAHQFIVDEPLQRNARLTLIAATRQILLNGLTLLGVTAPESM